MNSREGLGLKKSNTERATKIATIKPAIIAAPLIKPQEKATKCCYNITNTAQE